MTQVVKYLPSKCQALSSDPSAWHSGSLITLGVVLESGFFGENSTNYKELAVLRSPKLCGQKPET
jgi:hypothetical protein